MEEWPKALDFGLGYTRFALFQLRQTVGAGWLSDPLRKEAAEICGVIIAKFVASLGHRHSHINQIAFRFDDDPVV